MFQVVSQSDAHVGFVCLFFGCYIGHASKIAGCCGYNLIERKYKVAAQPNHFELLKASKKLH